MIERAVIDTGPLVSIVREREDSHKKCVAVLKELRSPLLTCWPVLTEAAWLLRKEPDGIKTLGNLIASQSVRIIELNETAFAWMINFLDRYASARA